MRQWRSAIDPDQLRIRRSPNRCYGRDCLSLPRLDLDHPVSVAVDVMTERVIALFLLSTPLQASYSMPNKVARKLSSDLLRACDQVSQ